MTDRRMMFQQPVSKRRARKLLKLTPKQDLPILVWLTNYKNLADGSGCDEFLYRLQDGRYERGMVSRQAITSDKQLTTALRGANAVLPDNAAAVIATMTGLGPLHYKTASAQLGWHNGHNQFIGPTWVAGHASKVNYAPPFSLAASSDKPRRKGKLADWRSKVGNAAKHSSLLQVLMSAAFAAPMLSIAEWPPFSLCVHGKTKTGKSTALVATASIIGIGDEPRLPKWNMTRAALQETASQYRDVMLPLDETAIARRERPMSEQLSSFIYALSGGREDGRHSSWQGSTGGMFRTIAIITSEQSLRQMLGKGGPATFGGDLARAYDLPALLAPGQTSIFDLPPTNMATVGRVAWEETMLRDLRAACRAQHGQAFKAFIAYLVDCGIEDIRQRIDMHIGELMSQLRLTGNEAWLRHAARSFGLIYAAGQLAIDAGILPVERSVLRGTVIRYFRASFGDVKSAAQIEDEAAQRLLGVLRGHQWPNRRHADRHHADRHQRDADFAGYQFVARDGTQRIAVKRPWLERRMQLDGGGTSLLVPALRWALNNGMLLVPEDRDPEANGFNDSSTRTSLKPGLRKHNSQRQAGWYLLFALSPQKAPVKRRRRRHRIE